nr:sulfotransferase [Rheinheimera maricola]
MLAEQAYGDAGSYLAQALALQPEHPVLWLSNAQLVLANYAYAAAVDYADKAVTLYQGNNMSFLFAAAKIMMQAEQPARAMPIFQRMLVIEPANLQVMHQLALCHFFLNKVSQASELLNSVIAKSPANAGAIHLRSALQTYTQQHNHIAALQQLVDSGAASHPAVYFALAKELEDIHEYDQSFTVLKKAAALMRKTLNYNEAAELASINGIIAATTDLAIAAPTEQGSGPIFIVGMPRTGTTLVERILTQHDDVCSVGEFSLFPQLLSTMANEYLAQHKDSVANLHEAALRLDYAELGRRYMTAVTAASDGSARTIDKLPVNFLYCGFIKKALPTAKIIHLRRNAMDSCYAIFKTLFINAYAFSYDLDELANYYAVYRKMMTHWHSVMPGHILDVQYEDLVTDATETAKHVTQWCGMTFKPELLDFHKADVASTTASAAQVRKPIYTSSVDKWRNVETQLAALKVKLQQAGVEV